MEETEVRKEFPGKGCQEVQRDDRLLGRYRAMSVVVMKRPRSAGWAHTTQHMQSPSQGAQPPGPRRCTSALLRRRKLKPRAVKSPAEGHTAGKRSTGPSSAAQVSRLQLRSPCRVLAVQLGPRLPCRCPGCLVGPEPPAGPPPTAPPLHSPHC